jgi:hypothetical protein
VTVAFQDIALSFMLSKDATFGDLADQLERLGKRRQCKPVPIESNSPLHLTRYDADSIRDLASGVVSAAPHRRTPDTNMATNIGRSDFLNLTTRDGGIILLKHWFRKRSQVLMAIRLRLRGSSPTLCRPDHYRLPEWRHVGVGLQVSFAALTALLITGSTFLLPAHAQSVPPGSYRASCTDIRLEDRTLTAVCRIADGREQTTSLTDVNRCVGDIENDNGALTCGHGPPMAPYRQDRR